MAKKKQKINNDDGDRMGIVERPAVVAVMGHIDHGKSTLLDYIRKENTVDREAGGITQHVAAYEAEFKGKKITFIDTPGHEAFAAARSRGANIADIAILVVAADDGVSEQTLGALEFIKKSNIPFIVAINKIDLPNADIQKTKNSLLENEVYLEGMGGDVSYVEISAKQGIKIDELLETVLLTAEVADLRANLSKLASGFVLESKVEAQKGISASLILKDGKIKSGQVIVSGSSFAPVRMMENFQGQKIQIAEASQPINIVGFNTCPAAGDSFAVFENKKEALKFIADLEELQRVEENKKPQQKIRIKKNTKHVFPLVIKADVVGSVDAIKHQIEKIKNERSEFQIIIAETGKISEKDVKALGHNKEGTIIGFNVIADRNTGLLIENLPLEAKTFNIIYELTDYLEQRLIDLTPKEKFEEINGEAKILKVFSWGNKGGVVGGEVISGKITKNDKLKVIRRGDVIGEVQIKDLQSGKQAVDEVAEESQFGVNIVSKYEVVKGDILQAIIIVEK